MGVFVQAGKDQVKKVMLSYRLGSEAFTVDGLSDLFVEESQVFESGGSESNCGGDFISLFRFSAQSNGSRGRHGQEFGFCSNQ